MTQTEATALVCSTLGKSASSFDMILGTFVSYGVKYTDAIILVHQGLSDLANEGKVELHPNHAYQLTDKAGQMEATKGKK